MTDQQPIDPSWELQQQWREQAPRYRDGGAGREHWLIDRAAQWGYDQRGDVNDAKLQKARDEELEACCEWLRANGLFDTRIQHLRAARRPKPPSLKEQALAELTAWTEMRNGPGESLLCDGLSVATIRRALEALSND